MFENFGLKEFGVVFSVISTIVGAIVAYIRKVQNDMTAIDKRVTKNENLLGSQTKDISKNDERLRKDIDDEKIRVADRFDQVEDDVKLLRKEQHESSHRMTNMENDMKHTREAVDTLGKDMKKVLETVTVLATKTG